jgi:hypothetical protein
MMLVPFVYAGGETTEDADASASSLLAARFRVPAACNTVASRTPAPVPFIAVMGMRWTVAFV